MILLDIRSSRVAMLPDSISEIHYVGEDHENQLLRITCKKSNIGKEKIPFFIIHGGFWKQKWNFNNAIDSSLVKFLVDAGHVTIEIEYRRVGSGGEWPTAYSDVLEALNSIQSIKTEHPKLLAGISIEKSIIMGHSAGGTIALLLSCEENLCFEPALIVALAPITDLIHGVSLALSDEGTAIQNFMACEPDSPKNIEKYKLASPFFRLPIKRAQLVVVGRNDTDVPEKMILEYCAKCELCCADKVQVLVLDADHYQLVTANSKAWEDIYQKINLFISQKGM